MQSAALVHAGEMQGDVRFGGQKPTQTFLRRHTGMVKLHVVTPLQYKPMTSAVLCNGAQNPICSSLEKTGSILAVLQAMWSSSTRWSAS